MAAARLLRWSSASFASPTNRSLSLPLSPPLSLPLPAKRLLTVRTMASATPAKSEWLVVVKDKPNVLAKRMEVRPTHFANMEIARKTGAFAMGGAILHDTPADPNDAKTFDFAGSTLIVRAESKADVIALLKKDIYYEAGVWDVDNADIYYLKAAFHP